MLYFPIKLHRGSPLSTSSCLHANPDIGTPAGEVNEEQCREHLTVEAFVDAIVIAFHKLTGF